MKKIIAFVFITTLVIAFTACSFSFRLTTSSTQSTNSNLSSSTNRPEISTGFYTSTDFSTTFSTIVDTTELTSTQVTTSVPTTSTTTASTTLPTTTTTINTTTSTTTITSSEPLIPTGYSLLQDELDYIGIPATGDVKILVFAVDFPDNLISNPQKTLDDIEIAFNGRSDDLVFESLRTYYQISSFGKLNLSADIFGFYTASQPASYYEQADTDFYATNQHTGEYLYPDAPHPDSDIIYELLLFYDDIIDYSDYDSNNDGFIDGIYVLYNYDISYESGSDLWWAYQYYYYYEDYFDDVSPNYYVWAGIDFMYEGYEDINARTFIHETGHMLGLDDYYDYYPDDSYNSGGLGTFMMDYTIGDHEPFSKILLGWITPKVVDSSMIVDILPHLENGDVLLIIDEWKNSIFDEYLLLMYYTPEGLNYLDQYYLFTEPGIIIFHVSAGIDAGYNPESSYFSIFNNNNSDSQHKLIKIIEADMGGDIDKYSFVEDSDLFYAGDDFGYSTYPNYQWYSGNPMNFIININSLTPTHAEILILFY